ncbi:MAG: hypothetical protein ACXVC7_13250 [Bacteroidia bacterium]
MKNAKKKNILFPVCSIGVLFFIFQIPFSSRAQDSLQSSPPKHFVINGFIKDLQSVSFTDNTKSLITGNYIHNRINFKWNISNNLHLRLESRNRLYYGEQVKSTPGFGKYIDTDNGYFNLTYNIISDTSIVFNTTLDRALLSWSKNKLDITVGRQRINWGINLVWNPNDIFNTFNYFDFDYEERPGSDAVRIQYNTGVFSSFQAAYKPANDKNKQVGALMYKTNIGKYDWQNFAGVYQQDMVAGTGWAGNIKQTGFKGEATYFHSYKTPDTTGILVSSISLDRTFNGNYFVMASYLYNSGGKDILYGASDVTKINLSVKNLMPFKHTVFAQVSKSLTPLVNMGFSTMFSPTKNSLILFPTVAVSLSDNWDLSLISQSFFAEVNNSYHTMGNAVYLRLRWSY